MTRVDPGATRSQSAGGEKFRGLPAPVRVRVPWVRVDARVDQQMVWVIRGYTISANVNDFFLPLHLLPHDVRGDLEIRHKRRVEP